MSMVKIFIGGSELIIAFQKTEMTHYVTTEHSIFKTIVAWFLGGIPYSYKEDFQEVLYEKGYKFSEEKTAEHFAFLFAIAPENRFWIPF